eukprot:scaffold93281_cov19-Tisochrysis_lutea.AAC.1
MTGRIQELQCDLVWLSLLKVGATAQDNHFLRTTFVYRTPQALHSVLGPWGPVRHTGVAETLHAVQQPPVGWGTNTRACSRGAGTSSRTACGMGHQQAKLQQGCRDPHLKFT